LVGPERMGVVIGPNFGPGQEHVFKCPKCGSLMIDLTRKTKLTLKCRRCAYVWVEPTLDKRDLPGKAVEV